MQDNIKKKVYSKEKPTTQQSIAPKKSSAMQIANAIASLVEEHYNKQKVKHEELEENEDALASEVEKKTGKKIKKVDIETEETEDSED